MTVTVLYFAALRELAGRAEELVELPASVATVGEAASFLAGRVPGLAERMPHVRVAKNEVFASAGEPVRDGDVLALIPPVAGG